MNYHQFVLAAGALAGRLVLGAVGLSSAAPQPSATPLAPISVRFSCSASSADLDRLGRCSVDIPSGKQLVIES